MKFALDMPLKQLFPCSEWGELRKIKPAFLDVLPDRMQAMAWPHVAGLMHNNWLSSLTALAAVLSFLDISGWTRRLAQWLSPETWYPKARLAGKL